MGVTRHTVRRWKICKHMMSQNYYEELTKWIKEEKLIGKKIETDG
jgi:predicted hydrolase (HD superfamily)